MKNGGAREKHDNRPSISHFKMLQSAREKPRHIERLERHASRLHAMAPRLVKARPDSQPVATVPPDESPDA